MTRVASLGMYDHPAQRAANDQLWAALARVLRDGGMADVPDRLDRSRPVQAIWRDPNLLFAQACGYPLVSEPGLSLRLVALPVYSTPGSAGSDHASFIVARSSDDAAGLEAFRGRRAAINDRGSNTGMNLFRAAVAGVARGPRFFAAVVETGSHRESVRAVAEGSADVAAIDAVTFAALDRFEPGLTGAVRIVARTPPSPTLPFVTRDPESIPVLQAALAAVVADPALADARAVLFLSGVVPGEIRRFMPLRQFARDAAAAGYPELR